MDLIGLFSADRLASYASDDEHRANFKLIKNISDKLGAIEIITRNKTASALGLSDSVFISRQTLGYWVTAMDEARIHNDVANFSEIDFRAYAGSNIKFEWRNYQKVKIIYSIIRTIRNRAFHFENLYKLNANGTPRLSTKLQEIIIGIEPSKIEIFLNDILKCFDEGLIEYLEGGAQGAP
jgi:hypothetical protein